MELAKKLHHFQEHAFFIITVLSFILYFIAYFGLSVSAPQYLKTLDDFIKLYVCLFLIFRFHPFRKSVEFTPLDQKIAFSAGMLILTSTFLDYFANYIKSNLQENTQTHPIHILDHLPEIPDMTFLSFLSL